MQAGRADPDNCANAQMRWREDFWKIAELEPLSWSSGKWRPRPRVVESEQKSARVSPVRNQWQHRVSEAGHARSAALGLAPANVFLVPECGGLVFKSDGIRLAGVVFPFGTTTGPPIHSAPRRTVSAVRFQAFCLRGKMLAEWSACLPSGQPAGENLHHQASRSENGKIRQRQRCHPRPGPLPAVFAICPQLAFGNMAFEKAGDAGCTMRPFSATSINSSTSGRARAFGGRLGVCSARGMGFGACC